MNTLSTCCRSRTARISSRPPSRGASMPGASALSERSPTRPGWAGAGARSRGTTARRSPASGGTGSRRRTPSRLRSGRGRRRAPSARGDASGPSAWLPRAELPPARVDVLEKPAFEDRPVELGGARPQGLGVEPVLSGLEGVDHVGERRDRRLAEEDPGRRRVGCAEADHRLEHAAVPERDRRAPRGGGFERHNPKILDRREEHRAAARVELGDLAVVPPAEELDTRPGERLEPPLLRTGADDEEPTAEPPGGSDRQVDALVGDERRYHEIVVVHTVGDSKTLDVNRRVDHVGLAAPDAPDPLGDMPGDRDEAVDGLGSPIPPAERGGAGWREEPGGGPGARADIVVGKVPHVAHGRKAVAEVERTGRRADPLGDAVAEGEHEVVAGEVEAAYRRREQREIAAGLRGGGRRARDGRGRDAGAPDHGRDAPRGGGERGERRRGGEGAEEPRTTPPRRPAPQPGVDERHT